MTASVSGLGAQGQAISVISDNLANTNTIGYKASRSLFNQMVTSSGVNGTAYNAGGVGVTVDTDQASQGSLTATNSSTDLAISGNGFFKVGDSKVNNTGTTFYYTRAGSFIEDKDGYLVNPQGYYLQGWKTDTDGTILNVQDPEPIELQSVGVSAQKTSELSVAANLDSTEDLSAQYDTSGTLSSSLSSILADPTLADYTTDVRVYDAQGAARDLTVAFSKRGANQWDWQLYTDGSNVQGGTTGTNSAIGSGILQFNTTGSLEYATGTDVTVTWAGGVSASSVKLDFGDYTGGKIVTATSAGLGYDDVNQSFAAGHTLATITGSTTDGTLADGDYSLKRIDATHVGLYNAGGTLVESATVATTGAQTINFATSGLTVTVNGSFDMSNSTTYTIGSNTVPGATAATSSGVLANGTYTVRQIDATHVALYDATNTTMVDDNGGTGYLVSSTGPETINFTASGVSITVDNTFDISGGSAGDAIGTFAQTSTTTGVLDGDTIDTFTESTTATSGGVLGIAVEDQGFAAGTYTVKKESATTMGLYNSSGTQIGTASIGATGTREAFFTSTTDPAVKVRMTVSGDFDETAGAGGTYPATVGTFTVTQVDPLDKGLGTDGITQLAANYNTSGVVQNGFGAGTLASIAVDEDGFVNGTFTNGEVKKLYRIALAEFQNPSGLEAVSGSLLRTTESSGQALLKEPNQSGTGRINGGQLEGSTTDIAGEFSNMIVAQRAFQASSKVITTVDQMLNDLLQLR